MQLSFPTKTELTIQALLGALLMASVWDYFNALSATPCSAPNRSSNCYPWGMTEGPMAEIGGTWAYANKEIYLQTSLVGNIVLGLAILAPFLARGRWSGIAAIAVILLLGRVVFWWWESSLPT
jgi:hypothetical protein